MKTGAIFRLAAATGVLVAVAQSACAQGFPSTVESDIPLRTTVTEGPDSATVSQPTVVPDSVRRTAKLFGVRMTKPSKAGFLSLMVPGLGQVYNHSWWKIPLALGAVGGTVYGEIYYQTRYRIFADAYNIRTDNDPETIDSHELTQGLPLTTVERGVIVYRRQRDTFLFYIALAHGAQILDAIVDAHLSEFDISDDLSLRWEPTMLRMPTAAATPGLGITLTLK